MTIAYLVALLMVLVDQIIKKWTTSSLQLHESRSGIDGLFDFYYIRNEGAGWGILQGRMWFFYVVTFVIIVYLIYLIYKHRQGSLFLKCTYGLLLGGAIGNLIDRIINGYVIDMFRLTFMNFPIFNVADMALSIGVVLLIIQVLMTEDTEGVL
ncbi:signal peptidase II [Aerococcaceae bacterium DSM 109653]|uniref:Lipoprotein signal peptidase n=1 Tax=Fundicoccus ignavus TaxID=2664442 RepID=A0A844BHT9_9LACT|nr:signal peptidase II [Fundicoccus ignavus]MRI80564.1 signal peptidase II [Fundicoccus ignavus]